MRKVYTGADQQLAFSKVEHDRSDAVQRCTVEFKIQRSLTKYFIKTSFRLPNCSLRRVKAE